MFTLEQIKAAHAKVKSGADFPQYIQDLKNLGVTDYITYVSDGHNEYNGIISSEGMYKSIPIASDSNIDLFKKYLKEHQQGLSDYLTFCEQSARTGVEKWVVDLFKMTCIYYDIKGEEMLQERIPG